MIKQILKPTSWLVMLTFVCSSMLAPVSAAMLSSDQYLSASDRAAHVATINSVLQRADVTTKLTEMGISPSDASERVARLSDRELENMAERIDELPAGSGALGLIGAVFVVLLILEITGVTNIFNRV